ncbi:MAG: class II D-tagatose-bisphosphate aldolase, non-catalytic subunit [Pseudomonadota bacterium]|nr:class II D-tagatose-bisphosphate aldolase, non-catalytic subunit [Pseudomonadota bacterium]
MSAREVFADLIAANRAGARRGIPSWCTAHPETLTAILSAYRDSDAPILIEATCNQVNQDGGYTGMTPAGFRRFVEALAQGAGVDPARLILGGDHLGPNPWKRLPAREAMARACDLTKAFVEAGFAKIHLDASMACGDESVVGEATIAERAAELCAAAESAGGAGCVYVIGTEVPIPGGELQQLDALAVTAPEAARRTYELHQSAFAARGVASALQRVVALVVQPGVDMGNNQVFGYDAAKAARLSAAVTQIPGVVYEAHSTDYQTERALAELVASHFAILKVGPMLTFAFREAVFALAEIEHWLKPAQPSSIVAALEGAMDARPADWRGYVAADGAQSVTRLYGLSDRIRYYWPQPQVQAALRRLFANIDAAAPPLGLVSQYVGDLLLERREPSLSQRVVAAKVEAVVGMYRRACGER